MTPTRDTNHDINGMGFFVLESRRIALYLSHRISGLSLKKVGEYFDGISISAVSQNSLRQEKRFTENPELLRTMVKLKEAILS